MFTSMLPLMQRADMLVSVASTENRPDSIKPPQTAAVKTLHSFNVRLESVCKMLDTPKFGCLAIHTGPAQFICPHPGGDDDSGVWVGVGDGGWQNERWMNTYSNYLLSERVCIHVKVSSLVWCFLQTFSFRLLQTLTWGRSSINESLSAAWTPVPVIKARGWVYSASGSFVWTWQWDHLWDWSYNRGVASFTCVWKCAKKKSISPLDSWHEHVGQFVLPTVHMSVSLPPHPQACAHIL